MVSPYTISISIVWPVNTILTFVVSNMIGSRSRARREITQSMTGISGATALARERRRTTGSKRLEGLVGTMTKRVTSGSTHLSFHSSRT